MVWHFLNVHQPGGAVHARVLCPQPGIMLLQTPEGVSAPARIVPSISALEHVAIIGHLAAYRLIKKRAIAITGS